MNKIKISDKWIGDGEPVYIIAEAGDAHFGNVGRAMDMILVAKNAGCDAIKFQHHIPDEEMLPALMPMSDNLTMPLYEFLTKYALTIEAHDLLKACCENIGIQYLCTPFSLKAAQELDSIGVDAFKIGSGEMTDIPFLIEVAKMGKPMIISTGMSNHFDWLLPYKHIADLTDFIFLDCISGYPPNYNEINLSSFRAPTKAIGLSDHTPTNYTAFAAVALGAKVIEKHFVLDRKIIGPDDAVSLEPFELAELVKGIRIIEQALGHEKKVHESEKPIMAWARRSVVSIADIAAGEKFTQDNIWTKRPGGGIEPVYIYDIFGKVAKKAIVKGNQIEWEMVSR